VEGTRTWVDLPKVDGCVGRVWDEQLAEYITVRWQMIAVYVASRPILNECRQGKQKRGAVLHRWWWEQQMDLDVNDAIGSDE
jgi:hypothetical protein